MDAKPPKGAYRLVASLAGLPSTFQITAVPERLTESTCAPPSKGKLDSKPCAQSVPAAAPPEANRPRPSASYWSMIPPPFGPHSHFEYRTESGLLDPLSSTTVMVKSPVRSSALLAPPAASER